MIQSANQREHRDRLPLGVGLEHATILGVRAQTYRQLAVTTSIGFFIALGMSGCSSELDDAIARGCEGLSLMAESYQNGDRAAFERARNEGLAFDGAVELASTAESEVSADSVVVIGKQAVWAYVSAAYEPIENNHGEFVWQGEPLTSKQQDQVDRGIAACETR